MAPSGVALDDERNRGALDLLRPPRLTTAMVTARLLRAYRGKSPADLAAQVARIMSRPSGADVPASQPLSSVADPLYGLGTHPDLIERLWKLNAVLAEDCRCSGPAPPGDHRDAATDGRGFPLLYRASSASGTVGGHRSKPGQ